jgi:hypothetical protein
MPCDGPEGTELRGEVEVNSSEPIKTV